MASRFYRCGIAGLGLLLGLAWACSPRETEPADGAHPGESAGRVTTSAARRAPSYVLPPGGDLVGRWIEKLELARREGLHFALEHLAEHPEEAGPRLMARLAGVLEEHQRVGLPHNLCAALGRCRWRPAVPVLVELLGRSPVPVVRSAAVEALRDIGDVAAVPALVAQLQVESELGPRLAILGALGRLGGPEAGAALEAAVRDWLAGRGDGDFGEEAWNNLLLLQDDGALARLQRLATLVPETAPPLRLQLLVARLELGEGQVGGEIRAFLDPERYPSGRVRALAVAGLAEAGAWEDILAAAGDPSPLVRQAAVEALGRPAAAARDLGRSFLEEIARPRDLDLLARDERELRLTVAAARVLRQRGARGVLDPWLRLLRGFPMEPGSVQALLLLKEPDLRDPRTAPLLVRRWEQVPGEQKVDLLRALAVLRDPSALPLFARTAREDPDPQLRHLAATTVVNLGPTARPLLQELATGGRDGALARVALAGLGRLAREGHAPAREFLLALLADGHRDAALRGEVAALLPRALGEDAWAPLVAAWREVRQEELRHRLDEVLRLWF